MILVCSEKLSLGSKVKPRTLGVLTVGMIMLLIVRFNCVSYSAGSGVKRVAVDLSGLSIRLFDLVQL